MECCRIILYAPTLDDLLNDKEYTLEYTLKLIRENKLKKLEISEHEE